MLEGSEKTAASDRDGYCARVFHRATVVSDHGRRLSRWRPEGRDCLTACYSSHHGPLCLSALHTCTFNQPNVPVSLHPICSTCQEI